MEAKESRGASGKGDSDWVGVKTGGSGEGLERTGNPWNRERPDLQVDECWEWPNGTLYLGIPPSSL